MVPALVLTEVSSARCPVDRHLTAEHQKLIRHLLTPRNPPIHSPRDVAGIREQPVPRYIVCLTVCNFFAKHSLATGDMNSPSIRLLNISWKRTCPPSPLEKDPSPWRGV